MSRGDEQVLRDVVEIVFHPTPSIERLYLELTNRCNLSCEMCYRYNWNELLGDMSTEVLNSIAGEVSTFPDLKEVILGGIGEPTIANNFRKAVEMFTPRYDVTVTTNGTTLDDEMIDFLITNGIARIVMSVDSTDVKTFNSIRHENIQGILESTRKIAERRHENIQGLSDSDRKIAKNTIKWIPEIIWEFVAMKSTLPYLVETIRQAGPLGVDRVSVSHILPMREEMMGETLYYPTLSPEIEPTFQKAFMMGHDKRRRGNLTKKRLRDRAVLQVRGNSKRRCTLGWRGIILLSVFAFLSGVCVWETQADYRP